MHLQESGEMYLETILILSRERPAVRAIDVSEYMGYSKPSVSRALGLLKQGGYVQADAEGYLSLTDSGREVAQKILERHHLMTEFLVRLGVSRETAEADACRLEHAISDESFEAIKRYAARVDTL
ncbi:MAG: metal-dependent transcriptional regulator [Clostridia bacterium]|nr:metal-dependent transcriptional regulator [Clostridia bacterium]